MPSAGDVDDTEPVQWLRGDEQRAWLAYTRVQLRLSYEMNRQLQADSDLSLADYDVLTALSTAVDGSMQVSALAAQIGWERSRLSHHIRRMERRGLVLCGLAASDRRATEIRLTDEGQAAIVDAAPGHVALVRRLFFDGLPNTLLGPLSEALEVAYEHIIEQGTLPRPASEE
jgi:DNA-binding MarR family transcriptional regulator